jgi:PAS domain S-box-containing protein
VTPARLTVAFLLAVTLLGIAGYRFYRLQERYQRDDAQQTLAAVSKLKVDQISRWCEDRLGDAAVLSESSYLSAPILQYLSHPTPAKETELRNSLRTWADYKAYANVTITDPSGMAVFSLADKAGPANREESAALAEALRIHRPVLTRLHREGGAPPHLSAVGPLFASPGGTGKPAGSVILQRDAFEDLYPLIRSWPTASRTAETLLVEPDGDSVLYLNELRHASGTAFALRVPAARREVPAVMAVNGVTGFVSGLDYRGVPVFADLRAVPGTGWFCISKIDVTEAMAHQRMSSLQSGGLVAALIVVICALFLALWQLRAKTQYQAQLEAGLARSESAARLAAIVDSSQDAITSTTNEGVVTAWNRGAEEMFGYSASEMIGRNVSVLAPPAFRGDEQRILDRLRSGERVDPFESTRLTKDGRLIEVSISISATREKFGLVTGSSRIARDITEQKRVRRDLDRLRWMLSPPPASEVSELPEPSPPCELAGRDRPGVILEAVGTKLLAEIAASFHVLMGTCFSVHEDNGEAVYSVMVSQWCRFLEGGLSGPVPPPGACELKTCAGSRCRHRGGRDASLRAIAEGRAMDLECLGGLRLYAVPIRAGDEIVGAMSLGYGDPTRDPAELAELAAHYNVDAEELERHAAAYETRPPFIVELAKQRLAGSAHLLGEIVQRSRGEARLREATENMARSNRELEYFAYVASHDLQEPLRMVASYTQLLAHRYGDKLDQDARDYIAYAVDGATRMKQLIEDLLAYSRVTAKARPAACVDTQNAFSLALRNLEAAIHETGAEITRDDLPLVMADGTQVVQVFQNLLSNAIKFHSPGNRPRIHVSARPEPGDSHRWVFQVSDNGIGIDPKYFSRIFAIFQRLHTRQEYPGTGIGLALCQRIVERHGGRIWIDSEPGRGSRFQFTFPQAVQDEENHDARESQRQSN